MKREFVKLFNLLLSDNNPRLEPSFGEKDAIAKMVKNQGEKLFNLASDIVENGLNPIDTIAIYPSEVYEGFFEVGEGNRRICALKLLNNPSLLQGVNENLAKRFAILSETYKVPIELEVGLFANEKELEHWMEIRHMGEQSGKGLSKWDAIQKDRFRRSQTGEDALLDFWDWLEEQGILSKAEISRVTKTNWQRVLREAYFPFLRVQFDGKFKVAAQDQDVFKERIRAVQQELEGKTVAIVYDKERIEKFYDTVSEKLYGVPYKQVIEKEAEQLAIAELTTDAGEKNHDKTMSENGAIGSGLSGKRLMPRGNEAINSTNRKDIFDGCKTIIPEKYVLYSSNIRISKIINELKKLDADEYPNACGALLRVLFELSAKYYLENLDGNDHTKEGFSQVITNAARKLRDAGEINDAQHSQIVKDVNALRIIFNGYMHNTETYPSSNALKNLFISHLAFIESCQK